MTFLQEFVAVDELVCGGRKLAINHPELCAFLIQAKPGLSAFASTPFATGRAVTCPVLCQQEKFRSFMGGGFRSDLAQELCEDKSAFWTLIV